MSVYSAILKYSKIALLLYCTSISLPLHLYICIWNWTFLEHFNVRTVISFTCNRGFDTVFPPQWLLLCLFSFIIYLNAFHILFPGTSLIQHLSLSARRRDSSSTHDHLASQGSESDTWSVKLLKPSPAYQRDPFICPNHSAEES